MAAQELRWLTYLLTDLGEQPRSPPVLYVDNKAMLALCREHRLEHRTKHIALRYFLARELQQRGQLRLAYVASQANTADVFTKALPPGDHQRFCTMLGFPTSFVACTRVSFYGSYIPVSSQCLPCVEGPQRSVPHSSSFPPTTAPLQTLHMDVWGLAPVSGTDQERHFLLVVDDYTRYTTVFPLRNNAAISFLRLHSDRGGEFSSGLLTEFYQDEGIIQSFTIPASPQQNGIAECRIGLIMEVARTSMIHAATSHFLWPFAVRYVAHQLNLWPRVPLPETSPTLRWTGKVGDASAFWVWGTLSLVRDTTASKLSPRTLRCAFLGFPTDTPPWQFYHPHSRRIFSSQDVTLTSRSVSTGSTRTRPTRSPWRLSSRYQSPPHPLYHLPPQGPAPSRVSQVDPPSLVEPWEISSDSSGLAEGGDPAADDTAATRRSPRLETPPGFPPRPSLPPLQLVAVDTGAAGGGDTGGEVSGGAETGGAETGGEGSGCAASGGAYCGGANSGGATSPSGVGAQLREWVDWRGRSGAGAWSFTSPRAAGAGAAEAADGASTSPHRPFFYPQPLSSLLPPDSVLCQVLSLPSSTGLTPPLLCPPIDQSRPQLLPGSPVPAPASHTEVTESLIERREPETRASTPVRARRVACPCPPPVPGTHVMALRPSSVPQRVALPSPPASSLPDIPDPEYDLTRAASPTVTRLLATDVTDPDFESTAAFSLVSELVDFAARSRLDYVASLVTESEHVCPPSVGDEPALGNPDALDIPSPRSYAEAIAGEYSSQWQATMEVEIASWKSIGTYVDEVPPPRVNIVDGMWIFRVKRPPGYPTTLAAFGFAPSSADPSLFLRTDTILPLFYVLVYIDDLVFATADMEVLALVKAELQERHTCTDLGEVRSYLGLQITRDRARCTITLTQSHKVHQVLQRFGFQYSLPQPTPLPTGHSLSAPPSDESVEPSGPYPDLVGCLMYVMTCTRPDLAYPLRLLACYVGPGAVVLTGDSDASWADDQTTQRSSQRYTVSLGFGSVSWRSTRSSSVLGSSCDTEIYTVVMDAQELCWLTYLLTDLGERPHSPPNLYVDNKVMLALCHDQRLEHRTKHIALRYFLARELQQRGQLRLSYVASRANSADVFTKALGAYVLETTIPKRLCRVKSPRHKRSRV
ncbi:unnamed protein product [Closterium sp. NIES-54]